MDAATVHAKMRNAVKDIRDSRLPFMALNLILENLEFDYEQYTRELNAELQDMRNKQKIIKATCEHEKLSNKEKLEFIHEIVS